MAFKRSMPSRREARFEWSLADLISNDRFGAGPSLAEGSAGRQGCADSGRSARHDRAAWFVKGSWTPAAEERSRALGRQASEKPRGRKPWAGVAHRCRARGLPMGI